MEGLLAADTALLTQMAQRWALIGLGDPALARIRIVDLLADERRLRADGRWVAGPTTLFEVLRLERDEVRNCRVVRWLLDPLAPHGLGADALRAVLDRVNRLVSENDMDPRLYPHADQATVAVEVTRGSTRADIVVTGPSWVVVVEAKIGAGEQDDQGRRLSDLWPGATYVFLTRRGHGMTTVGDDPWIRMRWSDLLGAILGVADERRNERAASASMERARRAVSDYLYATRGLIDERP